jgi:YidC/Oxa1 family membrane protein insertase
MFLWTTLVDGLASLLFALTHVCGGSLGLAIITMSLIVRLALLPLTLRIVRRTLRMQQALEAIQPQLARLTERHSKDPVRLGRERQALLQKHGIRPLRDSGIAATLLQLPFWAAFYSVIRNAVTAGDRFLWIGNLARPDALLALIVSVSAGLLAALTPSGPSAPGFRAGLAVLITLFIVWRLAAGLGLYWAASNAVGMVQAGLLRRALARDRA